MERRCKPKLPSSEPPADNATALPTVLGVLVALQVAELALSRLVSPSCQQLTNALLLAVSVTGAGWLYLAWQEQVAALGALHRGAAQAQRARHKLIGALLHDAYNQVTVLGAAVSMLSMQRLGREALRPDERQWLGLARGAQQRLERLLTEVEECDAADSGDFSPRAESWASPCAQSASVIGGSLSSSQ